jgi:hypothetical protein
MSQPRRVVHQLIGARIDKPHELNLSDGFQALRRHSDTQPTDQELGQRGIHDPFGSEPFLQSGRSPKHPAIHADILAEHNDIGILLHDARQGEVHGFD